MLIHLTITNFAIVSRLSLSFTDGMTVVTGETGAGKSIMLDALSLALGSRADSADLGPRADRGEVAATFDISDNHEALAHLEASDMLADEEAICILRRVITRDGRSRSYVNGHPTTLQEVKALADLLIDVHSQHEHQSLLKAETQRRLLDEFVGQIAEVTELTGVFTRWQERRGVLDRLIADSAEQSARRQLLAYQEEELLTLDQGEGELEALEAEQHRLNNAGEILEHCHEATELMSADDGGIERNLGRVIHLLESLDDPALAAILEMLETSRIQLQEAISDLGHYTDRVEVDPERLREVDSRLGEIHDIARKHRVDPSRLPELLADISEELLHLQSADADIEQVSSEVEALKAEYLRLSKQVDSARAKAAPQLAQLVTAELQQLGMDASRFEVALQQLDPSEPRAFGLCEPAFMVATSGGQAPRALGRIASGGELSRISLAIQVCVAHTSQVPTLIFDEVDVGIGGAVAEVVGQKLHRLGRLAQIICVTHLAQVASQGDHHLVVVKSREEDVPSVAIEVLDEEGRVAEIARMLGGIRLSEQTVAHARSMVTAARSESGS